MSNFWTIEEEALLRKIYEEYDGRRGITKELEETFGRSASDVYAKAERLGLKKDAVVWEGRKEKRGAYHGLSSEEVKKIQSDRQKRLIKENGHPRGMAGKKHTDETKAVISAASFLHEANKTPAQRRREAKKAIESNLARYGNGGGGVRSQNHNAFSRARRGKREDLGDIFFRSSWEANWARYLNFLVQVKQIVSWEYEPQTFVFHGITRGQVSYMPDFKLNMPDGSHVWHEVKGWMNPASKAKLKRMAKFYPEENVKVIAQKEYQSVKVSIGKSLPNWE